MSRSCPITAIVVPCFNEQEGLPRTLSVLTRLIAVLVEKGEIDPASFVFFVDDGSRDGTWRILEDANKESSGVKAIRLSRNFGHQQALLAGLLSVRGQVDCAISIDADLQQDVDMIPEFIAKYREGAEIVFGVREDRASDSWVKKWTALGFYRLMEALGTPLIKNHADYRLTSNIALDTLHEYRENNVFLRGIFADMGLPRDFVRFFVKEREAGRSKYTIGRMIVFALHGVSSFSVAPLRIISFLGFIIFSFSAVMGLYILYRNIVIGDTIPGWASTALPIYFLGGLQTLCIGILGEYIGNIYGEVKSRPKYIINQRLE